MKPPKAAKVTKVEKPVSKPKTVKQKTAEPKKQKPTTKNIIQDVSSMVDAKLAGLKGLDAN